LHAAAYAGKVSCVQRLIEGGCAIDGVDNQGNTALLCAAHHGHALCVANLINAHADTSAVDSQGRNALQLAQSNGHTLVSDVWAEAESQGCVNIESLAAKIEKTFTVKQEVEHLKKTVDEREKQQNMVEKNVTKTIGTMEELVMAFQSFVLTTDKRLAELESTKGQLAKIRDQHETELQGLEQKQAILIRKRELFDKMSVEAMNNLQKTTESLEVIAKLPHDIMEAQSPKNISSHAFNPLHSSNIIKGVQDDMQKNPKKGAFLLFAQPEFKPKERPKPLKRTSAPLPPLSSSSKVEPIRHHCNCRCHEPEHAAKVFHKSACCGYCPKCNEFFSGTFVFTKHLKTCDKPPVGDNDLDFENQQSDQDYTNADNGDEEEDQQDVEEQQVVAQEEANDRQSIMGKQSSMNSARTSMQQNSKKK
jgi:hypothetical protein